MRKKLIFLSLALTVILSFPLFNLSAQENADAPYGGIEVTLFAGTGSHGSAEGEAAQFNLPSAVFGPDKDSRLFVADTYNNLIRAIDTDFDTQTFSGNITVFDDFRFPMGFYRDGKIDVALFNRPTGGVVDGDGAVYIADSANHVIRLIRRNDVFTHTGSVAGHKDGRLADALFDTPSAIAMDARGNIFIADTLNHCIRRIDRRGNVTTLAGVPGEAGLENGRAATALFDTPMGIAVSADGTVVYVADTGNHVIRTIRNHTVRTLAGITLEEDEDGDPIGGYEDGLLAEAMFNLPVGLTLWNDTLIIADSANNVIRAIDGGRVLTLAGSGEPGAFNGPVMEASFNLPAGVMAADDVLYITDTGNNQIRQILLDEILLVAEDN
jgi:DNA-binding beta-propeller fold protein YncE